MKSRTWIMALTITTFSAIGLQTAEGIFIKLVGEDVTDAEAAGMGLSVCRVYAQFNWENDELFVVSDASIATDDPAGFYQHSFGTDTAPLESLIFGVPAGCSLAPPCDSEDPDCCSIVPNPELVYDSFVTIGVATSDGTDTTALTPSWNSDAFNEDGEAEGDWYTSDPTADQGVAGEDELVLIAQITTSEDTNVWGMLRIWGDWQPGPPYQANWTRFTCYCPEPPLADFDGDLWVTNFDISHLLAHWGPCEDCIYDVDDNDVVGSSDLAIALAEYGPCTR